MKFAVTVTLLAALFACAIAAPNPNFFENVAGAVKNWQQNLVNAVQKKQAEFTEAESQFETISQNLQSSLQSKWQELTSNGQAFAKQALSAIEKTKENLKAGVEAKRADAIAFAKKLSAQGTDFIGKAEEVKETLAAKFQESIQNLEKQTQDFITKMGPKWAEGKQAAQAFLTNAQEKFQNVKEQAAEKVKEAQAYAENLKAEADKVLNDKFGTSDYNEVMSKLSQTAQDTLKQYNAKLADVVAQGTEKAQNLMKELGANEGKLLEQAKSAWEKAVNSEASA